jgi:5-methylcytosine-specific restriction enzyme A
MATGLAGLTRESIIKAVEEFDRLGRLDFLKTYEFGPAREFFLELNGQRYDSKAIAGVAYKYVNRTGKPLKPSAFSGGEQTVKRRLEALGFLVVRVKGDSVQPEAFPSGSVPVLQRSS